MLWSTTLQVKHVRRFHIKCTRLIRKCTRLVSSFRIKVHKTLCPAFVLSAQDFVSSVHLINKLELSLWASPPSISKISSTTLWVYYGFLSSFSCPCFPYFHYSSVSYSLILLLLSNPCAILMTALPCCNSKKAFSSMCLHLLFLGYTSLIVKRLGLGH